MQNIFTKYLKETKRIVFVILAMGGILIDKITPLRILLLLSFIIFYIFFGWLQKEITSNLSVIIFGIYFISRYLFLFLSFVKNGIAYYLKRKYGEHKGFEIYQIITAFMFFLSASCFSLLVYKSKFDLPFYDRFNTIFIMIGSVAVILGITTNIWSTLMIGIDIYYYKDLFLGKVIGEFKKSGPYSLFSNPMYSLGQANGYGSALIYGSVAGVLFILLNQMTFITSLWRSFPTATISRNARQLLKKCFICCYPSTVLKYQSTWYSAAKKIL